MKAITKLLIFSGSGLIISILLVFVLIKPTLNKVTSLNNDLKARKTEAETLEQQILAFKTAQSDLSKVTQRDRILNAIVTSEDLVAPIQDIESAAIKTGSVHSLTIEDQAQTTIKKTVPDVIRGKVGVSEVPYRLSVNNDYEGLIEFLMYLENLPHFTEISSIRSQAETQTGSDRSLVPTGRILTNIDGVFFVKGEVNKPVTNEVKNETQNE